MPDAKDIKKKLFMGNGRPSRPSRNCTRGSAADKTTIDLLKCSSASFDNLIGEGAATSVISSNTTLKVTKKQEDKLKMKMLLSLNDNILLTDGVSLSEGTEISSENESDPIVKKTVEDGHSGNSNQNSLVMNQVGEPDKVQQAQPPTNLGLCGTANQGTSTGMEEVPPFSRPSNDYLQNGLFKQANQSDVCNSDPAVKTGDRQIAHSLTQADSVKVVEGQKNVSEGMGNGMQKAHEAKMDESSPLDATLPLFSETEVQTDPCYMLCTCIKCKDIVKQFSSYLNRGYSDECIASKNDRTLDQGKKDDSRLSLSYCGSHNPEEEERLPLFKGSKIKVSVTAKGILKNLDRNPDSTPKDFVYAIMDDLYDSLTMANMTAAGRGKSNGMEKWVREGIIVYLQNKFENIDNINSWVNSKCYCERRKKWGEGDTEVRPRLKKNVKSVGVNVESSKKKKKKKKRAIKDSLKKRERNRDVIKQKKQTLQTEDTENTSKIKKKKAKVRKEKGLESDTKHKSGSTSSGKSKLEGTKKKQARNFANSPPSKKAFKRKSTERPTEGGKRPKPLEELLRLREVEATDDNIPIFVSNVKNDSDKRTKLNSSKEKFSKDKSSQPGKESWSSFATSTPQVKQYGSSSKSTDQKQKPIKQVNEESCNREEGEKEDGDESVKYNKHDNEEDHDEDDDDDKDDDDEEDDDDDDEEDDDDDDEEDDDDDDEEDDDDDDSVSDLRD